ncbi:MAG: NAD(P)-dependent alcohol dehydrogenase [Gemmataceae bacterium]|nr:NAD(P)-dependent alcohol dehydrogenase [Gemmataceae bacterium]MCI0738421.1 NAD(P)-dependent alcohol dehydrogenase [Gemmataceae bacterium]
MKAIVYHKGSPNVFQCAEIEKPTARGDEVLIKVRAASVNPLDWRMKSTRPGRDVAGQVEAVGGKVTKFKPGDEVFGTCLGAFAEYVCAAERALAVKPDNVTFDQAASVPVAAFTALQGLCDKGRIQPGQRVLINGAAGGVGTFAVQIAKSFGADVTGVCSTRNVEMVSTIGADRVIDYTQEDFTKKEQRYDLILDCVGNHSLPACRRVLNRNGVCVMVGAPKALWIVLSRVLQAIVYSQFVSQTFVVFISKSSQEDLTILCELMKAGKVTPVIDRRYTLREVPEAIRYLEEGHARGKVVITLEEDIRT